MQSESQADTFVQIPYYRLPDLARALSGAEVMEDQETAAEIRALLAIGDRSAEPVVISARLLSKIIKLSGES